MKWAKLEKEEGIIENLRKKAIEKQKKYQKAFLMHLETAHKKGVYVRLVVVRGTHAESTAIICIIKMWMFCNKSKKMEYDTGVNKNTISFILKKMREIMIANYYNNFPKLGVKNIIVEIDKLKFGKRKYNRGKYIEGVWIFSMVERSNTKRIKLITVENKSKDTLKEHIQKTIKKDSIIFTDGWNGYISFSEYFKYHKTVNHSLDFVFSDDPNVHTNTIEGTWAAVKRQIKPRHRTKKNISLYLIRYMILMNEEKHPVLAAIKYLF